MNILYQKDLAQILLDKLELIDPYAILAGGAPRDWYLGNPASDLDFYIHTPSLSCEAEERRLERLGFEVHRMKRKGTHYEYKDMPGIRRIYEGTLRGQVYQIIIMEEPVGSSVVKRFGTSVCMASWKGEDIITTPEFVLSHKLGVIFKQNTCHADTKHMKKMVQKFPKYIIEDIREYMVYKKVAERLERMK